MSTAPVGAPAVGQVAPDFTLPSTAGSEFTLSTLRERSNVLVAFFPAAFTRVCTAEMCSFTEEFSQFDRANAVVVGISVDQIPSLKEFRAKHGITIDLLSDARRDVSQRYGVLDEAKFTARRSYFIVDRSGVLRWAFVEEHNGQRRDNRELLAELAKLR
ncbi:MAG TPA: redoxin domain-containing protein [Gemmatimonadales bacterium]|nr:redoxin domain-containing protein [Gemmatimonadales bacterium]